MATTLLEDEATSSPQNRPDEDRGKHWLAVLVATTAFFVTVTAGLSTDASNRAAEWARTEQEDAITSTNLSARGQLAATFANAMLREYDQLEGSAWSLNQSRRPLEAGAFITAAQVISAQTPLLSSAYTTVDPTGWRQTTHTSQFEAETWVVTATLYGERSEAAANVRDGWGSKVNLYKAAIVVFAVVLFLLALATVVTGCIRGLFVVVSLALGAATLAGSFVTAVQPVTPLPDAALEKYARGYGYAWQADYVQAIKAYSETLDIAPSYAKAQARRGVAWFYADPPLVSNAIRDLETARRVGGDNYSISWNLGWAFYLTGDYARSIEASQRALELSSRICGPEFNIALARLAMGQSDLAEKEYEAAISRCEGIVRQARQSGLDAPYTIWNEIGSAVEDIENLLCSTNQGHCYPGREQHDVSRLADRAVVLKTGEKYIKRIKEALTGLEYLQTTAIKPSGARFESLSFGSEFTNDAGDFEAYVYRGRFPSRGPAIYAVWDYSGLKPGMSEVWKVYVNGEEEPGLRYVESWKLADQGSAVKKINSWFTLVPARYDVEVYEDGEMLAHGSFDIDARSSLVSPPSATGSAPAAPVGVGDLVFQDDFVNNDHGWWSSSGSAAQGTLRQATLVNGEFQMVSHKADYAWRVTCEACGPFDDFYYQAAARYVGGPKDYGYGLAVRGDRGMDDKYLFVIDEKGSYRVSKNVGGKSTSLTDWTASSSVHPGQTNRLGVLARGSSLEFFINGDSVTRVTDATLSKGYVGFTVDAAELAAAFTEARVWRVK